MGSCRTGIRTVQAGPGSSVGGDHVSRTQLPHMHTTYSRVFSATCTASFTFTSRVGAANHADAPMGGVIVVTCSCDHVASYAAIWYVAPGAVVAIVANKARYLAVFLIYGNCLPKQPI